MPETEPATGTRFTPKVSVREKDKLQFRDPMLSLWLSSVWLSSFQLMTVAGAAVIAKTAVAPLERVKILLQVYPDRAKTKASSIAWEHLKTRNIWCILQGVVRTQGWQGLYRGHGANVARILPEVLLKFGIHDQLRVIFGATASDPTQLPLSSRIAAGSVTGLLRTVTMHPLSVIRTRIAADVGSVQAAQAGVTSAPAPPSPAGGALLVKQRHYRGIADCVAETWRRERIRGFYGGFTIAACASVPYLAVCFTVYDSLTGLLPQDKHSVQQWWFPLTKMSMAAGAGLLAQLATYPLDTVRRRMEVTGALGFEKRWQGPLHCANSILQKEGVKAFYRGMLANCVKTVPSTAIQFIAYDSLKSLMMAIDPATAASARI